MVKTITKCEFSKCRNVGRKDWELVAEGTGEFLCDVDDMPMALCPTHFVEVLEDGISKMEQELGLDERKQMDQRFWPQNEDLLQYTKEASEHKRAWSLVAGLSKTLLAERRPRAKSSTKHTDKATGPKPQGYDAKIHELEHKVVQQKKQLRVLDECRTFERETERLLIDALKAIFGLNQKTDMIEIARDAILQHMERLGPRDPEPQPSDGPEYHEDHAAWVRRQRS